MAYQDKDKDPYYALNAKYQEYLRQWESKGCLLNRYNLFFDLNYWDRRWLRKVRKLIIKRGLQAKRL
jgi:hypothetical protein